jgi:hypothetical protein
MIDDVPDVIQAFCTIVHFRQLESFFDCDMHDRA